MTRTLASTLVLALVLGGSPMVRAEDPGDIMLQRLYLKICNVIIDKNDKNTKVVFSYANPGIAMKENINTSALEDMKDVLIITDKVWAPTPVANDTHLKVSDQYGLIMAHNVCAKTKPDPKEQAEFNELSRKLTEDEPWREAYFKYQGAYIEALADYQDEQSEYARLSAKLPDGSRPPTPSAGKMNKAKIKRDNALRDWELKGFKGQWEKAQNTLRELRNVDQSTWWNELMSRYDDRKAPQSQIYVAADFIPSPDTWKEDGGWVNFSFTTTETFKKDATRTEDWDSSLKVGFGKFGGNGKVKSLLTTTDITDSSKSSTISFKLKRVLISRPWLNWGVFTNQAWTFKEDYGKKGQIVVSSGATVKDAENAKAILPSVSESLVLIKDFVVKGKVATDIENQVKKSTTSDGGGNYGPFVSGKFNYKNSSDTKTNTSKTAEDEISSGGIMVIGYLSTLVPKSPDPLPGLKFK